MKCTFENKQDYSGNWTRSLFFVFCVCPILLICISCNDRSSSPDAKSTDLPKMEIDTCIDRANGSDVAGEECARMEIDRIRDLYARTAIKTIGDNQAKSEKIPFDDVRWNKHVIEYCQSDISKDLGITSYKYYGTMEKMLYRMCVLDQTKLRFESLTGKSVQ